MNMKERLQILQQISGKTQTELAKEIGVSHVAFNAWWTGKSIPRADKAEKVDVLLATYGIKSVVIADTKNNPFEYKKRAVLDISKKHKNVLKRIVSRVDLIDELSLQITYNSNAIEGSTLSIEDTASVIFDKRTLGNKTLNEQLEAKNHDKAFRYLLEYIQKNKPIDETLTKILHKILMAGIRDDAGMYRINPVRITGSYVPTANYLKVPDLMKKVFPKKLPKDILEYVSHFHADFEKIHPFGDGNGRVGRLLMIGMLLQNNFAPAIILKKNRPKYYKALQKAQLEEKYGLIESFIYDAVIEGYRVLID